MIFIGAVTFGYIISNVSNIIQIEDDADTKIRDKSSSKDVIGKCTGLGLFLQKCSLVLLSCFFTVTSINAYMGYRKLPPDLQKKIRNHYEYTWKRKTVYDEKEILQNLPTHLRTRVALYLNQDLIRNVAFLRDLGSDCVVGSSLVTLANHTSKRIDQIVPGDVVLSLSRDLGVTTTSSSPVLVPRAVSAVLPKGERPCLELSFLDGTKLVCTPDHRVLQADGSWLQAKDMVPEHSAALRGIVPPVDDASEDAANCAAWQAPSALVQALGVPLDMAEHREATLVFFRLLGYVLTNGTISVHPKKNKTDQDSHAASVFWTTLWTSLLFIATGWCCFLECLSPLCRTRACTRWHWVARWPALSLLSVPFSASAARRLCHSLVSSHHRRALCRSFAPSYLATWAAMAPPSRSATSRTANSPCPSGALPARAAS